jgi:hypothetical protein
LRDPEHERATPVNLPASGAMPAAGEVPERYQLLGEIARGGMGAILKGCQRTGFLCGLCESLCTAMCQNPRAPRGFCGIAKRRHRARIFVIFVLHSSQFVLRREESLQGRLAAKERKERKDRIVAWS